MNETAIVINKPIVVSETIDGEAIIVHHRTGYYFEAVGSAALIWQMIEGGTTPGRVADMLSDRFSLDRHVAEISVARFIDLLEKHDLVASGQVVGDTPWPPASAAAGFAEPELRVHSDLSDLLLLDPIHDVDASGWPAPRAPAQPG